MNTNHTNKEIRNTFYQIIIGAAKFILLGVSVILLYTFFGESFTKDFQKKVVSKSTNSSNIQNNDDWDKVENGIHLATGLIYDDSFDLIRGNCTPCHSGKLIAQNRATREGWTQMIRWMQATQGLWDLGKNEPKILDYLATHYAPKEVGRRSNIDIAAIEWYILELDK